MDCSLLQQCDTEIEWLPHHTVSMHAAFDPHQGACFLCTAAAVLCHLHVSSAATDSRDVLRSGARTKPYCVYFLQTNKACFVAAGVVNTDPTRASYSLFLQVGSGQSLVNRVREAHGVADMQALVDSERFTPNHICEALHRLAHQCDPVRITGPDFYFALLLAACTNRSRTCYGSQHVPLAVCSKYRANTIARYHLYKHQVSTASFDVLTRQRS